MHWTPKGPNEWKKDKKRKQIPFRDVKDCYLPQKNLKTDCLPKNWQFAFYVDTVERVYVLCAKTAEERSMWMAGFNYLIASTITVQQIMKSNNQRIENKLKEKTTQFIEEEKTKDPAVTKSK